MRPLVLIRLLAAAPLLLAGALPAQSNPARPAVRAAIRTLLPPQDSLSTQQQGWLAGNCPRGVPRLGPAFAGTPTRIVSREGYALQHSSVDRVPLWVCEGLTRPELEGTLDRADVFMADSLLPPGTRAELADYRGSGFDRGHMAPSADHRSTAQLNAETFFLSNMAPQAGPLNQQIWRVLEDSVRKWLIRRDSGYVITGGFFYDPAEDDSATADGLVKYRLIGPNAVAVPTHFYKIVSARNSAGTWEVIAFVMENRGYERPFRFGDFITPVDWIEERTGIDFFPDLPARDQAAVEAARPPLWR